MHQQFLKDTQYKRFQSETNGGFKIQDFRVLDESLQELQRTVTSSRNSSAQNQLIIIELARNDYRETLKMFAPSLIQNARFLFIDADAQTCLRRIQQRAINPVFHDNSYISDEAINKFYSLDNWQFMALELSEEYKTHNNTIVINNTDSLSLFETRIEAFARFILSDHK